MGEEEQQQQKQLQQKQQQQQQQQKQKRFRQIRRTWIPIIKNIIATTADIIGDWVFYFGVARGGYAPDLVPWILTFSIVSSVLGFLAALSLIVQVCVKNNINSKVQNKETRFQEVSLGNVAMLCEMIIEDIPQFILTWMGRF